MANWTGAARTNYVKIKDFDALLEAVEDLPISVDPHPTAQNFVSFEPVSNDSGDFSMSYQDDDGGEVYWSWQDITPHLVEGQVLIVMTVGNEKLRYLTGYAEAYSWDGRMVGINIDEIYARAASTFNVPMANIAFCTYQELPQAQ